MNKRVRPIAGLAISTVVWACDGKIDLGPVAGDGGVATDGPAATTPPPGALGAPGKPDTALPSQSCNDNGTPYAKGATWRCSDGCNQCWCNNPPSLTTTTVACNPPPPPPAVPDIAACDVPAGAVQTFSSTAEVYAAMAGLWQICPGAGNFFGAPSDTIGIEYGPASSDPTSDGSTAGGLMYYLVKGPSGPVRGQGIDYQLTYDVSPEGPGSFQLNMHPSPNSGFGGSFRYSPSPRQFQLDGGSVEPGKSWTLVSFN